MSQCHSETEFLLRQFFFKQFRFTLKLNGRHRDIPFTCLTTCLASPITNIPHSRVHLLKLMHLWCHTVGFPSGWVVKNVPDDAGDTGGLGSIPGLGRAPGEGNGNPLQYSCQENPVDRGAWKFIYIAKSWTGLGDSLFILVKDIRSMSWFISFYVAVQLL